MQQQPVRLPTSVDAGIRPLHDQRFLFGDVLRALALAGAGVRAVFQRELEFDDVRHLRYPSAEMA